MTEACPYETEQAIQNADIKRFNKRVLVEPLVILSFILGYCAVQTWIQNRDQAVQHHLLQAENIKLKRPKIVTCIFTKNNIIHQYPNCKVVADKYARLD